MNHIEQMLDKLGSCVRNREPAVLNIDEQRQALMDGWDIIIRVRRMILVFLMMKRYCVVIEHAVFNSNLK